MSAIARGLLLTFLVARAAGSLRGRAAVGSKQRAAVTPVEKVTELLTRLQTELEGEAKAEAAEYDKYACFCKEQIDKSLYVVDKSTKKINGLTVKIDALNGELGDLAADISSAGQTISGLVNDIASGANTREAQHETYLAAEADISAGIDALKCAIEALKESKGDMVSAKVDFMQLRKLAARVMSTVSKSSLVVPSAKQLKDVTAMTQLGQDPTVYEYHSNAILATLQGLLKEFIQQKNDLDQVEFDERSAFEKRDLNLKNEMAFLEKEKAEKEKIYAFKSDEVACATEDKEKETNEMNADLQYRSVLETDCQEKADLWDQRSQKRAEELTAIAEALDVLKTKVSPSWSANKKLVDLQTSKQVKRHVAGPPSLLQVDEAGRAAAAAKRAVRVLSDAAHRLNSKVLTSAVLKANVAEDHFAKVRSIIHDLLARLEDDALNEGNQKSFCDTAVAQSVGSRDAAQDELEQLAAARSTLESVKAEDLAAIANHVDNIAALEKALLEAQELRTAESEENAQCKATAEEGKAGVELALQVLQEFYALPTPPPQPTPPPVTLLQSSYVPPNSDREGKTVGDRAPKVFQDEYNQNDRGASKGIIGLLQVILADFERTITTVTDEEKAADGAFQTFKTDVDGDVIAATDAKEDLEAKVESINLDLVDNEGEAKEQKKLLDSALKTLSTLAKQCVQGEETYAERVAAREKEIEALKRAHSILEDWKS